MIPRPHQVEGAKWALDTIRKYGLAYLIWEERTGKTLTALKVVEDSLATSCLILTKKKAIEGWTDTLDQWEHTTKFTIINYEAIATRYKTPAGKTRYKLKYKAEDYDFLVLDEAHHAISATSVSTTNKLVKKLSGKKPILYLSATPYSEHIGLLFNQLALSCWSPFKAYKSFLAWYAVYGVPNMARTPYGLKDQRNKFHTEQVLEKVDHLFNFKTRAEVGIEHEPSVNLVIVPLLEPTKRMMNVWKSHRTFTIGLDVILGDSDMKQRMVHYQLEGGTLKIDDKKSVFTSTGKEKINYIKENYKEEKITIMAHFVAERNLLEKSFPKAQILSSDGHAEGVDLSAVDKLIIYSMSFKTSKYTQRLARQANHKRTTPIIVDILVCGEPAIGEAVYTAVAIKKENFVKNSYERAIR